MPRNFEIFITWNSLLLFRSTEMSAYDIAFLNLMAAYTANSLMQRLSKWSLTKVKTNFYSTVTEAGTNISAWLYSYAFHSVKMGWDGGVPIPLTVSIALRTTRNGEGDVKLFIGAAYFPQSLLLLIIVYYAIMVRYTLKCCNLV